MAKKPNGVQESLDFIIKRMATKEDVADLKKELKGDIKKLDDRLIGVEGKVSGIDKRLDAEAIRRDDEKIPRRVANIEKKVFGASRAPVQ